MNTSMEKMDRTPKPPRQDSADAATTSHPPHGGMMSRAMRRFPNAPKPFLDLSTGINPIAYPLPPLPPEAYARLPDEADEQRLLANAAASYGVADPAMVAAAPGTQILISLIPVLLARPRTRVTILSPTYSEHAVAWACAGHAIHETASFDDLAAADIAVLCNPNNPTGRRIGADTVIHLADAIAERRGLLVVDESFADLEPDGVSVATLLPHPAIIVLRSFGKSYGLAGIRLGFALTDSARATILRRAFGPWAAPRL
eukprot:gene1876-1906_t